MSPLKMLKAVLTKATTSRISTPTKQQTLSNSVELRRSKIGTDSELNSSTRSQLNQSGEIKKKASPLKRIIKDTKQTASNPYLSTSAIVQKPKSSFNYANYASTSNLSKRAEGSSQLDTSKIKLLQFDFDDNDNENDNDNFNDNFNEGDGEEDTSLHHFAKFDPSPLKKLNNFIKPKQVEYDATSLEGIARAIKYYFSLS